MIYAPAPKLPVSQRGDMPMKWFVNFSTRAKLLIGFGVMFLFLATIIVMAYNAMTAIQESQKALYDIAFANVSDLINTRSNLNGSQVAELTMLLANRSYLDTALNDVKTRSQSGDDCIQTLLDRNQSDPRLTSQLEDIKAKMTEYEATRDSQFVPLIQAGNTQQATALSMGVQRERYDHLRTTLLDLANAIQANAASAMHQSQSEIRQVKREILFVGLAALLIGLLMAAYLGWLIAEPLRHVSRSAQKIAAGELGEIVRPNNRKDEVGVLTQTFADMTSTFHAMAGIAEQMAAGDLRVQVNPQSDRDILGTAFASLVRSLRDTVAGMSEGITVLTVSSSQISSLSTQLAASATEAASAVNETTATVEEIRQTAHLASEVASTVADSAQNAVRISKTGKQATDDTITGMNQIRHHMESIADSMAHLSEESQVIGGIIATVDDLAQQSNLLAVNAAIQAATAGEHGRGFAVVAQEVKILAEQSRLATAQVRANLNDIQKATAAAVMATEMAAKSVDSGLAQSVQAAEAIVTLSDSVSEAAQVATQIAASSRQQLVGIDQVVLAMETVKETTNQNVDSARQLETSAHNITELGRKLKQQVEHYQV
jgi:methyl-accepting chemotaxis protein